MNDWYFKPDDVKTNRLWGFDYCFCGGDCVNTKCGRNGGSESYKEMIKSEPVYSCSDFTGKCEEYIKPMTEEEVIAETLGRR